MILSTEPLINVAPHLSKDYYAEACRLKYEEQFQVLDMLTGKICPELGGNASEVDVIGLNYYFNNQWTYPVQEFICWKTRNCNNGWKPLHEMIEAVYNKYQKPFIIAETSHPDDDRPLWFEYISEEIGQVLLKKLPLLGVCFYPVIDRPDWDFTDKWHRSGIWDIYDEGTLARDLHQPTFDAVQKMQKQISFNESIF